MPKSLVIRGCKSSHTETPLNIHCMLSHVLLFATPWTVALQAPLSMGFSRQEYWGGLPFLSPGDLPNPGIEPRSPALQADSLPDEPPGKLAHSNLPIWSSLTVKRSENFQKGTGVAILRKLQFRFYFTNVLISFYIFIYMKKWYLLGRMIF